MTVRAAGAVVVRYVDDMPLVCLVHRPHYDDWTLPKGKIDKGESDEDAARREVFEETGIVGTLLADRHAVTRYRDDRGREKTVMYFLMRYTSGDFAANQEVDKIIWLSAEEAATQLTYKHDGSVIRQLLGANEE
ncbi:MAG: NUDIX hydrolase [Nitrospiraceae bacterium]|nr:NUDIX hydrolase [Nitrospiraceae bacterium]